MQSLIEIEKDKAKHSYNYYEFKEGNYMATNDLEKHYYNIHKYRTIKG